MTLDDMTGLLVQNSVVVFTTYRRDGRPQMSLVTVGRVGDALGFTTDRRSAKYGNLLRDPRCAMMVMTPDLRNYAVLDGDARLVGAPNADAETVRLTLRDVYRAAARKEHPDWEEYDRVVAADGRVAVLLTPTRVYGVGV
jgi:PPOX class probable F420-dependent enzyme